MSGKKQREENIRVVPFSTEDLRNIEPRPVHEATRQRLLHDLERFDAASTARALGPAWTMVGGTGQVVAIGGILPNGEAWLFVSRHAQPRTLPLMLAVRRALTAYPGAVYAKINEADALARKFARKLGFRPLTKGEWVRDPSVQ